MAVSEDREASDWPCLAEPTAVLRPKSNVITAEVAAFVREFQGARMGMPVDEAAGQEPPQHSDHSAISGPGQEVAAELFNVATAYQDVKPHSREEFQSWLQQQDRNSSAAQVFQEMHRSSPSAAERLARAVTAMPQVGGTFAGFRLVTELGKGAFGRVFLAQQGDLANRLVVLKISPDIDGESQTLAQLQHTNVVPIYSTHRSGPLQAVCMPFFGATTLAGILKDLRGRQSLPESGQGLLSTLVGRKSTLRENNQPSRPPSSAALSLENGSNPSSTETGETRPPRQAYGTTPILDMLQRLSYVEAVLWIATRLADGLAHAHEHGILHRDLKPANVLLTDEGQPMLLDFNLARDTKVHYQASAALIGGTLPYMAPEQMQAYQVESVALNPNSDLYSLGIILFELMTGRHPFPIHGGPVREILEKMIADRQGGPPEVHRWNKMVSPAVESIIRHCLEPDPKRRYQSAQDLKEDLERQLTHQPLKHAEEPSIRERARKWVRRHPRLASSTSVGVFASVFVAGLLALFLVRGQRLAGYEASAALDRFTDERKTLQFALTTHLNDPDQLAKSIQRCRQALGIYGVLDNAAWQEQAAVRHLAPQDQERVREQVGETLLLLAHGTWLHGQKIGDRAAQRSEFESALEANRLAERCFPEPQACRALWSQRGHLLRALGRNQEGDRLLAQAAKIPPSSSTDRYLLASQLVAEGQIRKAMGLLLDATEEDPRNFYGWFMLGICHDRQSQHAEAAACFSTCVALWPQFSWAHLNRGLAYFHERNFKQACVDFDRAIELAPDSAEAYTSRALARQGLKEYKQAIPDLTRALELGAPPSHIYFVRARIRELAGDVAGAKQDRDEGFRREPSEEQGWVSRASARMDAEPEAALADFDRALALNAQSLPALQNKAHVLAKLGRNAEAVEVLNKAVELYPDFINARAGRGILLARLDQRDAALRDADQCLLRDTLPLTLYQIADIFALTSRTHPEDRREALRLLSSALRQGCGFDLLEDDPDLAPIRNRPEFQKLVQAARTIRAETETDRISAK